MSNCRALKSLLKSAGYHDTIEEHFPTNEKMEVHVTQLEKAIRKAKYERTKSACGGEYSFEYAVEDNVVTFNYRDAETGLAGWYINL